MKVQNVNLASNITTQKHEELKSQKISSAEDKNGSKKIALSLIGLAVIATASVGAAMVLKGKSSNIVKLKDINFDKGIANFKGKGFTGTISDTLKNGDKINMEYIDGVLQKSSRQGEKTFEKVYTSAANGDKLVKITQNGETVEKNLTKLSEIVKNKQSDFKSLLTNKEASLEELKAFDKTYLSSKQKQQLEERIINKQKQEIKEEALRRTETAKLKEKMQEAAQTEYNKPFENALSHKSAKESAEVFEQEIKEEALKRTETAKLQEKMQEAAQAEYNKPFEDALSHKSAQESAEVFQEKSVKAAQAEYNKPFEDALSHKSAKKSAEVFEEQFKKEQESINYYAEKLAEYDMKDFSRLDPQLAKKMGYAPVDKTYNFPDGTSSHIVFEGFDSDIDDQGRILLKVKNHVGKHNKKDITKEVSATLGEILKEKAEFAGYQSDRILSEVIV